jgi:hypothetical protein
MNAVTVGSVELFAFCFRAFLKAFLKDLSGIFL